MNTILLFFFSNIDFHNEENPFYSGSQNTSFARSIYWMAKGTSEAEGRRLMRTIQLCFTAKTIGLLNTEILDNFRENESEFSRMNRKSQTYPGTAAKNHNVQSEIGFVLI